MASRFKARFGITVIGGVVAALFTGLMLRTKDDAKAPRNVVSTSSSTIPFPTTRVENPATERRPTAALFGPSTESAATPLTTLNEILASHADNDPRLDTELLHLDKATKRLFRTRYGSIPREEQNARGTIVFLLGRDIESAEDVEFLNSVLNETPCLSLEGCDVPPARTNAHEAQSEMALVYSQAVAIVSFEKFLASNPNSELRSKILESIRSAKSSRSTSISRLSEQFLAKFDRS